MMDSFVMDRYFTKSKVGSKLQGWMQKTQDMLMTWEEKLIEDVMILEWCLEYSTQTKKQECGIFQMDL